MHSKYLSGIVSVELLDVFDELRHISDGWHIVVSTLREFVIFFENLRTIEIAKDDTNKPSVFWISYSSTIVSFGYHVIQGFVRDFIVFV